MSVRKKAIFLDGFFRSIFFIDLNYFHFTACTSVFCCAGESVAAQPQLPPQPAAIAGFSHLAKVVQPFDSHALESDVKTEFDVLGKTFLKNNDRTPNDQCSNN